MSMPAAPGPGLYGRGRLNVIPVLTPAAGADWGVRPTPGATWRIVGGSATLRTSAAVANRQVNILLDDGQNELFGVPSANVQAASLTTIYEFVPGAGVTTGAGGRQCVPLPQGMLFDYRFRLKSVTAAIDVGDTWTYIVLFVEEWLDFPQ